MNNENTNRDNVFQVNFIWQYSEQPVYVIEDAN